MTTKGNFSIRALVSLSILALFFWGVGKSAFIPSLRLLQDTQWDFSLFVTSWEKKLFSIILLVPVLLGFFGWAKSLQGVFFKKIEPQVGRLLGFAIGLVFFSLYVFGLAINEVLVWPLTFFFFVPMLLVGWREYLAYPFSFKIKNHWGLAALGIPVLLWVFEYLSPPIIWDAVLDHFRYAREVSRLHQIPFHWTNHTGDMPKFAELILAGFWNLGGESLSKISSASAALLTAWLLILFTREWKGSAGAISWIYWTCPFFLAIFAWGYVEGFLAFYEVLALFCLWKAINRPEMKVWVYLSVFFLGVSFSTKYTAVLAIVACGVVLFYERVARKNSIRMDWKCACLFFIPVIPWLLKNFLANGNPFYPMVTVIFGGPPGFNPQMEGHLWEDTGSPGGFSLNGIFRLLWNVFFTRDNSVGAAWTPLVWMSLPWVWSIFRKRMGTFLGLFTWVFFTGWLVFCTSLRHAAAGAVVLALMAAMAWGEALKEKRFGPRTVFILGAVVSLWLCLVAQFTSTAPYSSALGLEDNLSRLKRNYYVSYDTFEAYRGIEKHSDPRDKVMAFAVYQTYPLERTAFVDFFWKKPIFLKWALSCKTAEQLALKLRKEGVSYFLYQQQEAAVMSLREKNFRLDGMPRDEYVRFWRYFMDPVFEGENTIVFKVLEKPFAVPRNLKTVPGA